MANEIDLSKATMDDFKVVNDDRPIPVDIVLPCILVGIDKSTTPTDDTIYVAHMDVIMGTPELASGLMITDSKGGIIHLKCINGKEEKE